MFKKIFLGLLAILILLIAFVLIKTVTFTAEEISEEEVNGIEMPEGAIERFQKSITFPTISYLEPEKLDTSAFLGFHRFMKEAFPLIDSIMEREVIGYSLLYKWEGSDPSLPSVVMMGHFDVVPVDESTMDKWEAGPFSGDIVNDHVVGRGTMDDKVNVLALMETAELMIREGFQPKQTLYFSFGHDEEVGGDQGARKIAEYLGEKGEKIYFVIDEGGYIADGIIDGLSKPVAIINTGEKGFVSFKLTINTPGGHSSAPPTDNTIGSLAKAIVRLEENQFEYRMLPVIESQIQAIGPHFDDFMAKMAFANTWLFGGQLLEGFNMHTTTAPTMISGGVKDNVIPTEASVVVNFRIMQGESVDDIREHIINTINDDRIKLSTISNVNEPSPISDDNSESFKVIAKTIRQLFPGTIVSPGLVGGGTDSKHFIPYADNVYRFYPTRLGPSAMTMFHGNNEQMSISNYHEMIQFNYQLIKNIQD